MQGGLRWPTRSISRRAFFTGILRAGSQTGGRRHRPASPGDGRRVSKRRAPADQIAKWRAPCGAKEGDERSSRAPRRRFQTRGSGRGLRGGCGRSSVGRPERAQSPEKVCRSSERRRPGLFGGFLSTTDKVWDRGLDERDPTARFRMIHRKDRLRRRHGQARLVAS